MEDVNTINGLLLLEFGKLPKADETISIKGVTFTIIEVDVEDNSIKTTSAKKER